MEENKELKVIMLGTGCPRPETARSGPAQVVFIDELPILVDCGEGVTNQLMRAGIAPEEVNHLFITHLHSDHMFGYDQFLLGGWELGRRKLTVVGPKGLKKHHETLLSMYEEDIDYRLSTGRSKKGLFDVNIIELEEPGEVQCDLPATITTAEMDHSIFTLAYRFQVGPKSIVVSGDTAPTDNLIELSRGADILIHDCCLVPNDVYYENNPDPEKRNLWARVNETHCTPAQAAYNAKEAGVKTLILTHLFPNIDTVKAGEEASQIFAGNVVVPDDLQIIPVLDKTPIHNK